MTIQVRSLRGWLWGSPRRRLVTIVSAVAAAALVTTVLYVGPLTGGGRTGAQPTAVLLTPTSSPTPTVSASRSAEPIVETLAFLRDGDVWLIAADGSEERRLGLVDVQSFSWISPDELDVVAGPDRSRHLLVDLEGNSQELSFPSEQDATGGISSVEAYGSWSRDATRYVVPVGKKLVVFDREGEAVARLSVKPPPLPDDPISTECDSDPRPKGRVFGPPVFTPDGGTILVAVYCGDAAGLARNIDARIYRVSLGGEVTALPVHSSLQISPVPRFSADGGHFALRGAGYVSICWNQSALSVGEPDGSNLTSISLPELEELYGQDPRPQILGGATGFDWSADNESLAVSFDVSVCDPATQTPTQFLAGLYVVGLNGGPAQKLLEGPTRAPAWSPSGDFVAYEAAGLHVQTSEPSPIRLLDLATGEVLDLTTGFAPAWQPLD